VIWNSAASRDVVKRDPSAGAAWRDLVAHARQRAIVFLKAFYNKPGGPKIPAPPITCPVGRRTAES